MSRPQLIAEIGNNHFGDFLKAKELIKMATDSGADFIKLQAYEKGAVSGSMPPEFYEACRFTPEQYAELIEYAQVKLNKRLFYSIFPHNSELAIHLMKTVTAIKYSATQTGEMLAILEKSKEAPFFNDIMSYYKFHVDLPVVVMSVKAEHIALLPRTENALVMYACPYLAKDPELNNIQRLRFRAKNHGYSDHTLGISWCLEAWRQHKVTVIEKHFTDVKNKSWGGQVFRDTIHGATPKDFESLANITKGQAA